LITEHAEYLNLGTSTSDRATNYRSLFEQPLSEEKLAAMRDHTQSGTPLENSKFREEIEAALAMKTGQPFRGRPRGTKLSEEKGL
jgi:putative transposase